MIRPIELPLVNHSAPSDPAVVFVGLERSVAMDSGSVLAW